MEEFKKCGEGDNVCNCKTEKECGYRFNVEDQVKIVLENFNFEKVRKVMQALDWNWEFSDGRGVPDIQTLKNRVEELMTERYNKGVGSTACGGFYIFNDNGKLSVSFIVTEISITDYL